MPRRCLRAAELGAENYTFWPPARKVPAERLHPRPTTRARAVAICVREGGKFYEYYQISADDADDDAEEFGTDGGKELKSRTEGSHSLFGIIWSIQKETGWTRQHILWGVSWINIQLGIADSPKPVRGDKVKRVDDAEEILDLFE